MNREVVELESGDRLIAWRCGERLMLHLDVRALSSFDEGGSVVVMSSTEAVELADALNHVNGLESDSFLPRDGQRCDRRVL